MPLTSNTERLYPGEALVHLEEGHRKAMADQLTTVAKERLTGRLGTLTQEDLVGVEQAIRRQLGLEGRAGPR